MPWQISGAISLGDTKAVLDVGDCLSPSVCYMPSLIVKMLTYASILLGIEPTKIFRLPELFICYHINGKLYDHDSCSIDTDKLGLGLVSPLPQISNTVDSPSLHVVPITLNVGYKLVLTVLSET